MTNQCCTFLVNISVFFKKTNYVRVRGSEISLNLKGEESDVT